MEGEDKRKVKKGRAISSQLLMVEEAGERLPWREVF